MPTFKGVGFLIKDVNLLSTQNTNYDWYQNRNNLNLILKLFIFLMLTFSVFFQTKYAVVLWKPRNTIWLVSHFWYWLFNTTFFYWYKTVLRKRFDVMVMKKSNRFYNSFIYQSCQQRLSIVLSSKKGMLFVCTKNLKTVKQ